MWQITLVGEEGPVRTRLSPSDWAPLSDQEPPPLVIVGTFRDDLAIWKHNVLGTMAGDDCDGGGGGVCNRRLSLMHMVRKGNWARSSLRNPHDNYPESKKRDTRPASRPPAAP